MLMLFIANKSRCSGGMLRILDMRVHPKSELISQATLQMTSK